MSYEPKIVTTIPPEKNIGYAPWLANWSEGEVYMTDGRKCGEIMEDVRDNGIMKFKTPTHRICTIDVNPIYSPESAKEIITLLTHAPELWRMVRELVRYRMHDELDKFRDGVQLLQEAGYHPFNVPADAIDDKTEVSIMDADHELRDPQWRERMEKSPEIKIEQADNCGVRARFKCRICGDVRCVPSEMWGHILDHRNSGDKVPVKIDAKQAGDDQTTKLNDGITGRHSNEWEQVGHIRRVLMDRPHKSALVKRLIHDADKALKEGPNEEPPSLDQLGKFTEKWYAVPCRQRRELLNGWDDRSGAGPVGKYMMNIFASGGAKPHQYVWVGTMEDAPSEDVEIDNVNVFISHGTSKASALKLIDKMRDDLDRRWEEHLRKPITQTIEAGNAKAA